MNFARAQTLIEEARQRGLAIWYQPDGRVGFSPAEILEADPAFTARLKRNKPAILECLRRESLVYLAKQVIAGEFDGADNITTERIGLDLMSFAHPLTDLAVERLQHIR